MIISGSRALVICRDGACTFRPTTKSIFKKKNVSSYFDLPGNEKSNSRGVFPFSFPRQKEEQFRNAHFFFIYLKKAQKEFRMVGSFFLFLKETKKEFKIMHSFFIYRAQCQSGGLKVKVDTVGGSPPLALYCQMKIPITTCS